MTDALQLKAFYATLFAICYLVTVGAVLVGLGRNVEAIAVGAAVTGLIGIARIPSSKSTTIDNTPANPVNTTDGGSPPSKAD